MSELSGVPLGVLKGNGRRTSCTYLFVMIQDCLLEHQNGVKAAKSCYLSNLVLLFHHLLSVKISLNSSLCSVISTASCDPSAPRMCLCLFDQFKPSSLSQLLDVVKKLRPTSGPTDRGPPPHLFRKVFDSVDSFILLLIHVYSSCFPAPFEHHFSH